LQEIPNTHSINGIEELINKIKKTLKLKEEFTAKIEVHNKLLAEIEEFENFSKKTYDKADLIIDELLEETFPSRTLFMIKTIYPS
jgi:fructose-1,6-bisphosphatase